MADKDILTWINDAQSVFANLLPQCKVVVLAHSMSSTVHFQFIMEIIFQLTTGNVSAC